MGSKGKAPTSTPIQLAPAQKPAGFGAAKDFFNFLPQLMQQPYPEYGGQIDPGLSPTMQNILRRVQRYSESPSSPILGEAMGGLGAFMNGGAMPSGPGYDSLLSFTGGDRSGPGNPWGGASDFGFGARPLGPGLGPAPAGWSPTGAAADTSAMNIFASQWGAAPGGGGAERDPWGSGRTPYGSGAGGKGSPPTVAPQAGGPSSMFAGSSSPGSVTGQVEFLPGDEPPGDALPDPNYGGGGGGVPPQAPGVPGRKGGGGGGGGGGKFTMPAPYGGLNFSPSFVGWDPQNPTPWMTGGPSSLFGGSAAAAPGGGGGPSAMVPNEPAVPGKGSPPTGAPVPPEGGVGTQPQGSPVPYGGASMAGGSSQGLTPAGPVWPSPGGPPPGGGGKGSPPTGAPEPPGGAPSSPFGPTGAYDVLRNSVPVMNDTIRQAVEGAMGASGLTGNRYSSAAANAAATEGGRAGLEMTRDMSQRLYDATQAGEERALRAGLGAGQLESSGLDRMLQAMGMAPGFAQTEDELARNRLQLPFQMGAWEQGRQDQFGQQGYQDFERNKLGWLPMVSGLMGGVGGSSGGAPTFGMQQTGGQPSGFETMMSFFGPLIGMAMMASDARLKEDIRPIDGALAKVRRLKARSFRWLADGREDYGVVAQEVAEAEPRLVGEAPDKTKTVSYGGLVGLLLGAVQELAAEVAALRSLQLAKAA